MAKILTCGLIRIMICLTSRLLSLQLRISPVSPSSAPTSSVFSAPQFSPSPLQSALRLELNIKKKIKNERIKETQKSVKQLSKNEQLEMKICETNIRSKQKKGHQSIVEKMKQNGHKTMISATYDGKVLSSIYNSKEVKQN